MLLKKSLKNAVVPIFLSSIVEFNHQGSAVESPNSAHFSPLRWSKHFDFWKARFGFHIRPRLQTKNTQKLVFVKNKRVSTKRSGLPVSRLGFCKWWGTHSKYGIPVYLMYQLINIPKYGILNGIMGSYTQHPYAQHWSTWPLGRVAMRLPLARAKRISGGRGLVSFLSKIPCNRKSNIQLVWYIYIYKYMCIIYIYICVNIYIYMIIYVYSWLEEFDVFV